MEASEEIDAILRDFDEGLDEASFVVAAMIHPGVAMIHPGVARVLDAGLIPNPRKVRTIAERCRSSGKAGGRGWRGSCPGPATPQDGWQRPRSTAAAVANREEFQGHGTPPTWRSQTAKRCKVDPSNRPKISWIRYDSLGTPLLHYGTRRGKAITDFCTHHSLGLRQRLELFIQVCQAIRHAHLNGVIHRDITPSNVLVADGEPPVAKVIDFGNAEAIGEDRISDLIC